MSWLLGGAGGAPVQAGQGGGLHPRRTLAAHSYAGQGLGALAGRPAGVRRRSPDAAEGGGGVVRRGSSSAGSGDAPTPRIPRCRWPDQGVALRFASMSRPGLRFAGFAPAEPEACRCRSIECKRDGIGKNLLAPVWPLAVFYYKGVYTVVRGLSKSITRIGDGTGQHHHQSPTGNSGDMQRYGAGLCAVERQCIFVGKVRRIVSLDGRWILCRMGAFIADVRRARAHAHPSPGDQAHAQASCAWAYAWA